MATEFRLPDVGGEIEEVTITRWLVKEGDRVKAGDVVLEVATDKVDTEVPAPVDGVILKRHVNEGELVSVTAVLAVIGEVGDQAASPPAPQPATAPAPESDKPSPKATPVAQRLAEDVGVSLEEISGTGIGGRITKKDVLAQMIPGGDDQTPPATPQPLPGDLADAAPLVVRRLAAENNLNLRALAGDRPLSTLTKYDVLSAIASREAGKPMTVAPRALPDALPTSAPSVLTPAPAVATPATPSAPAPAPAPEPPAPAPLAKSPVQLKPGEEFIPHSRNRLLTARVTARAAQTIPHVTTWWDVNMARVLAHRKAHKDEFAAAGVNLTVTTYLIKAAVAGLKAVPAANSAWTDEGLILKRYYNIGMAVALPGGGLIVPVIKNVDDLSLMGVARAVNDLAERARANKLKLEELQDCSFTVTNYGTSGSRFQTPIIVEGQAGILGVGAIEKRAVVVSQGHPLEANTGDYLAFLPMLTLGFSYDHRILDGATADAVCAAIKDVLENWS